MSRRPTPPAWARGPFPTELDDDIGGHMLERGGEYGTTTGRQRRCGWLDLVALRYAARINGLTGLVITKLDVLSGIDPLRSAPLPAPRAPSFDDFPYHQSILHSAEAVYEELPGFDEDIGGCRSHRRPARRRARLPRVHRRLRSACRSSWSASAPAASRSSGSRASASRSPRTALARAQSADAVARPDQLVAPPRCARRAHAAGRARRRRAARHRRA